MGFFQNPGVIGRGAVAVNFLPCQTLCFFQRLIPRSRPNRAWLACLWLFGLFPPSHALFLHASQLGTAWKPEKAEVGQGVR